MRKNGSNHFMNWGIRITCLLVVLIWMPSGQAGDQKLPKPPVFRLTPIPPSHFNHEPVANISNPGHHQNQIPFYAPTISDIGSETQESLETHYQTLAAAAAKYRLIYTRTTVDGFPPDKDLFIIHQGGSERTRLTSSSDCEFYEGETSSRIVFTRWVDSWQLDLYSVLKTGSGLTPLAVDGDDERFIAICGDRVIYAKNYDDDNGHGDFYSITVTGANRILLASDAYYSDLIGEWLVYEREVNPANHDLYTVKVDGTLAAALATADESELYAGNCNDQVIFHRIYPSGNHDLYATAANGGQDRPTCLASSTGDDLFAGVGADRVYFNQTIVPNEQYRLTSIRSNGTNLVLIASAASPFQFYQEYNNRVIACKGVENFFSYSINGGGEIRISNKNVDIEFLGMLGGWIVYTDGYATMYQVYGANYLGGTPVLLSDWLDTRDHEEAIVDPISQKVIIQKLRNLQIDLTSVKANNTQRFRFTTNTQEDCFWFSTADCHIYSTRVNDQWNLFSYNFRTGQTRTLANSSQHHESVPYRGGGPVQ